MIRKRGGAGDGRVLWILRGWSRGRPKGEGLGNKFLAHVRECEVICHVVRVFKDSDVTHVVNSVDPKRDIEVIQTELSWY